MEPFVAGQYRRAGLILPGARGAEVTMRPYSMVNAPDQRPHEILLTLVPQDAGGIVSPALHQPRSATAFALAREPTASFDAGGTGRRDAMVPRHRHRHRAFRVDPAHGGTVAEIPPRRGRPCRPPRRRARRLPQRVRVAISGTRRRADLCPVRVPRGCPDAFSGRIPPPSPMARWRPGSASRSRLKTPIACSAETRKWSPTP